MATALSSSGPGFVYLLIEAFIDAGVHIGFRRDVAEMLALQTFIGSAKYAEATGKHAAAAPQRGHLARGHDGGWPARAGAGGCPGAIVEAIEAAYDRARELGG